ncbi:hypothetical protein CHD15_26100 (plasmid) [Salmonella enterica]|nr:hypothetical protein CHD15_26100 [Salmonella enterica]
MSTGADYIVYITWLLVVRVCILQKEKVMPLTLNSFIQVKPDHVPVKVFYSPGKDSPDKVVSLTRGERLLRKAGKLPGFRHGEFMRCQMALDDMTWENFGNAFCKELRTDYKQFDEYRTILGMDDKPLTPLNAREIVRIHQVLCRNRPHPDRLNESTQVYRG